MSEFQEGNQLLVRKMYSEAIAKYMAHARSIPAEFSDALARAAEAYLRMTLKTPARVEIAPGVFADVENRRDAAMGVLHLSLKSNPNHFESLVKLSTILKPRSEEIFDVLQKICAIQDHYLSLIAFGDELRYRRRLEDAYAAYERAQKSSPKDETAYKRLADVCRKLGRPDEATIWTNRWQAAEATKRNVGRK